MRFVICYDVADDARRARVAEALLDFGVRIQESVFLATLDSELHDKMAKRLSALVDPVFDSLYVFALCRACFARVWAQGQASLPEDLDFYIV